MLRFLLLFLILPIPVHAVELLRDRYADKEYIFEADQFERAATADAARSRRALPTGLPISTKILSISKTVNFGTNHLDSG